jgi:two-component system OmpR family response regulator
MSGAHVLVIEDDEWVARLLAVGLREAGHRVTLCTDGASGITTLHREVPDCVVCDVELPDIDGFAIGRSMRGAGGRLAATPLLFLCARDEEGETKLEALRSGGDAYLSKPFRIDEVAWTVTALIRLAERNRGIAPISAPKPAPPVILSTPPASEPPNGVLEGDLAKVSIATILTVLEMEKHTGELEMTRGDHTARLHVEAGNVDSGHLGELQTEPISVLRTVLTWTRGRFRFAPSKKPAKPMTGRATIGALLMEAARLEDEFKAGIRSDKRVSTLPPVSSRVNDLLGAAFPSTLPDPPPESDPLASPPPPASAPIVAPVAPVAAAGPSRPTPVAGTPIARVPTPAATHGVSRPAAPKPNPSPMPFPAVPAPKPSPRPGGVPAAAPSPRPGPPRLPTPVATPIPRPMLGADSATPIPTGATPFPPIAVAAPPGAGPTSAMEPAPASGPPMSELGVSSIIDDEWDTSDEAPMSLQPMSLQPVEPARGGPPRPPPPPPKRPPTGPAPVAPPVTPTPPEADGKS